MEVLHNIWYYCEEVETFEGKNRRWNGRQEMEKDKMGDNSQWVPYVLLWFILMYYICLLEMFGIMGSISSAVSNSIYLGF